MQHLVWLAALLNIFIGLFNLFPIPALDGSRIFFMILGKAFGKPLNPKMEEGIHLAGFAFLLLLMVLVTYQDIARIVTHKGF
jgi:regulator of sigma E protease